MSRLATGLLLLCVVACGKANQSEDKPSPPPAAGKVADSDTPKIGGSIVVAAASDLTKAFEELAPAFEARTGTKVVFKFGSTGMFASQLKQGAPFDVFAAANLSFVDDVVAAGACDGATATPYAVGRIVLWSQQGGVAKATGLADLTDARFVKIAIANPEHAPYGKAAKEALEAAGVYAQVKDKLVFGENIKQTMQFAETGNAEVAIIALSLAIPSNGEYTIIDAAQHQPLRQAIVACKGEGSAAGARAFIAYVTSDEGRATLKKFGFEMPAAAAGP